MQIVRGKKIETLYDAGQIAARNAELAADIASGPTKDLLVIAVLKGSFIFAADLTRALHAAGLAPEVEFITLSSYGTGTVSQGVKVVKDIDSDVHGRDILLIDDILESGRTLSFAKELMYERGARNVTIAVLLDKREKRKTDLEADYVGFECPDHFVVGYGMDVAYAFRELPFVGVVTGDANNALSLSPIGRLPIDKESLVFSLPDDREGGPMAKILITEDEDSLRIFVARALRLDGHETVEAPDGAAGLDALTDGGFDLLLSDIRMPVMDGIELAHKASAAHPALKILLMTGYADQRERADDLTAKIVDVVSKPFSLPDIRRAVAQALAA